MEAFRGRRLYGGRVQSYIDNMKDIHPFPFFEGLKYYLIPLGIVVAYAAGLIGFTIFVGAFLCYIIFYQVYQSGGNYVVLCAFEGLANDVATLDGKMKWIEQRLESMDKGLEAEFHNLENGLRTLDGKLVSISEKIS